MVSWIIDGNYNLMNGGREKIRERIIELLTAAADSLGVSTSNIYENRTQEVYAKTKFPCIVVNTFLDEEVLSIPVQSPVREYELQLPVMIECAVSTDGPIGNKLDVLQDAILGILLRHEMDQKNTNGPVWGDLTYARCSQKVHEENNKTIAVGGVMVNIMYQEQAGVDIPGDFAGANVKYDINIAYRDPDTEADPDDLIADTVDMPEGDD